MHKIQGSSMQKESNLSFSFNGNWDTVVLFSKNKYVIYVYSSIYFFALPSPFFLWNHQTSSIYPRINRYTDRYTGRYTTIRSSAILSTYFLKIKESLDYVYCKRVLYSGKGYRIYVRRKFFLYFKLNYAHKLSLYSFNVISITTSRWSMIFFAKTIKSLNDYLLVVQNLRFYNTFTKKGIRLKKQILYHKIGKVSSY